MSKPIERRDNNIEVACSIASPSHFTLSAAINPHPCGHWGNSGEIAAQQCRCSFRQIENYRQRISGPLLDRIDIYVEVPPVTFRELSLEGGGGESSAAMRGRVVAAREIQAARFRKSANATDSAMGPRQVKTHCKLDSESIGYL